MKMIKSLVWLLLAALLWAPVQAEQTLKPFILAADQGADRATAVAAVKEKLRAAGFEIAGEYSPYEGTSLIAVSNNALRATAARTDFGVFGAAQRVSVTETEGGVQVAYTNPRYVAQAYRMEGDLADIAAQLEGALGNQRAFGSASGLTEKKLRNYQYKWLMPYFYDRLDLATYSSYDAAVNGVEAALLKAQDDVRKVYRIDIPGQEATIFGVHMLGSTRSTECAGDQYIMERIDFTDTKASAHLPYEIVVKGKKAYALRAEFRIAISFPDLSMMGSNSFASIMCAPTAIEDALILAAGGTKE